MVQIIPAVDRGPSTSQRVGEALGKALVGGLGMYQQHQKQKRQDEAFRGVEDIYSNPDLSPEQKFVKAFSTLREFPDTAREFASGLSKFSESPLQAAQRQKLIQETDQAKGEESYFDQLMGGGQKTPDERTGMTNEDGFDMSGVGEGTTEGITPKRKPQAKFDINDATTWTDKQINSFRAYEGKNAKGKSLARKAQNEFENRKESKQASAKYKETVAPLRGALDTLDEMEKIGGRGNLGIGTRARGIISPKTRKDAAQYERLGKSLISFSSNIPIRNRQEFETLAHDLYDPSISDDARAGILAAMRRIIQNSLEAVTAPGEDMGFQPQQTVRGRETTQRERPPLQSFFK